MNKIPRFLKKGDTVGIVAPAGFVEKKYIDDAIEILTQWGLKVKIGEKTIGRFNIYSGTDDERSKDFQSMLDDDSVQCILTARGGYGSVRIIDLINFASVERYPKWIIGFSDITVFHSHLNNLGIASIHGCMPKTFHYNTEESILSLKSLLFGEKYEYSIPNHRLNITGSAEGEIIGGNLSIILSLLKTPYDANTSGKILFIEDLNEQFYHMDRIMQNLKHNGTLHSIKGLIVGSFSDMKDSSPSFGMDAYAIIHSLTKKLGIPVCFNFPSGHTEENLALYFGVKARFSVHQDKRVSLEYSM